MKVKQRKGEFFISTDHGDAFLKYRIEGNKMVIYETIVPPEERHKGIATALTEYAFSFADKNNLSIVDECSFTTDYIKKKAS